MATISTVTLLLAAFIFIVALLYSTVGHAGASGYLAAMALFGIAPAVMKPTARYDAACQAVIEEAQGQNAHPTL